MIVSNGIVWAALINAAGLLIVAILVTRPSLSVQKERSTVQDWADLLAAKDSEIKRLGERVINLEADCRRMDAELISLRKVLADAQIERYQHDPRHKGPPEAPR